MVAVGKNTIVSLGAGETFESQASLTQWPYSSHTFYFYGKNATGVPISANHSAHLGTGQWKPLVQAKLPLLYS